MTVRDKIVDQTKVVEKAFDPQSLSIIERIFYYEHQSEIEADNDNRSDASSAQDSACFDSWAMPDYLRN